MADSLTACAAIVDESERLACYDLIARRVTPRDSGDYVEPTPDFLESELRVRAEVSEFTLAVSDFVDMLEHAVTDEGQRVVVHGWTRHGARYVLHITMREPLEVVFIHHRNTQSGNFSVLQPVVMNGVRRGAEAFLVIVAAMSLQTER